MKKKRFISLSALCLVLSLGIAGCGGGSTNPSSSAGGETPAELPEINMVVFSPPSLGAFLPPIIEKNKFDEKNGIRINFTERDTDAYNNEFASGQYPVGGSAALLSEANRMDKGVKVTYLFNLFNFWGTVISANPEIQTIKDLENKNLAAAKSTTNYAMFSYFAHKAGVDLNKMAVMNAGTAALNTYASADRADGVQLWEPGYSTLINNNPGKFHEVDFGRDRWKEYTGSDRIPYLGVAAHQDWVEANKELVPKLYQSYVDAANWLQENPQEAAEIIAEKIPGGNADVILQLIENNDRLGMDVVASSELVQDIKAVFQAGVDIGYIKEMPDESIIYTEKLQ
ncbi:ABC transporter substrate-binding protein [Brevibacillus sp. TJ4]|uniref:ABC transporter substrate-binding protein n=1 Tax=Brevibacillus sp. TJ4 TaxID=3234853 RepID=UPI003BA111A3